MSDSLPTTEGIRWVATEFNAKYEPKEFDRWLVAVKADAWQEGMMSVKKHVSCWPKQDKLPVNPYIPEIGKTLQHFPETGNNV